MCSARLGVPRVATGAIVIDFDGTSNAHSVTHSVTHSGEHLHNCCGYPVKGLTVGCARPVKKLGNILRKRKNSVNIRNKHALHTAHVFTGYLTVCLLIVYIIFIVYHQLITGLVP